MTATGIPPAPPAGDGRTRVAFATGRVVPLAEVDDPAFAQGMLGEGVAIRPVDGRVLAPCAGQVVMVADTRHAIGITSDLGEEILLHFGLETVGLAGEGMTCTVRPGDTVVPGQEIADVEWDRIRDRIDATDVILVITNATRFEVEWPVSGNVAAGQAMFTSRRRE